MMAVRPSRKAIDAAHLAAASYYLWVSEVKGLGRPESTTPPSRRGATPRPRRAARAGRRPGSSSRRLRHSRDRRAAMRVASPRTRAHPDTRIRDGLSTSAGLEPAAAAICGCQPPCIQECRNWRLGWCEV